MIYALTVLKLRPENSGRSIFCLIKPPAVPEGKAYRKIISQESLKRRKAEIKKSGNSYIVIAQTKQNEEQKNLRFKRQNKNVP